MRRINETNALVEIFAKQPNFKEAVVGFLQSEWLNVAGSFFLANSIPAKISASKQLDLIIFVNHSAIAAEMALQQEIILSSINAKISFTGMKIEHLRFQIKDPSIFKNDQFIRQKEKPGSKDDPGEEIEKREVDANLLKEIENVDDEKLRQSLLEIARYLKK